MNNGPTRLETYSSPLPFPLRPLTKSKSGLSSKISPKFPLVKLIKQSKQRSVFESAFLCITSTLLTTPSKFFHCIYKTVTVILILGYDCETTVVKACVAYETVCVIGMLVMGGIIWNIGMYTTYDMDNENTAV